MLEKPARLLWYVLLWLMRRPSVKRLRYGWIRWIPASKREKAWDGFCAQERWARKNGVLVLQVILGTFLIAVIAQAVAAWAIHQDINGAFDASEQFSKDQ